MFRRLIGCLLTTLLIAGCSSGGAELAPVSGRVTLDGQPLPGARIRFQPEGAGGSPSFGTTDKDGRFELAYKRGQPGAMIGMHTVRIELGGHEPPPGNPTLRQLPARYNDQSDLRREVRADGENTFDFELTSQ